ncbi:MAG: hypothetical protein ACFHX7_05090 [Pseudomonadota bacterium]
MADRKVIRVIVAWLNRDYGASHCLMPQYSSSQHTNGTRMRYFFSLPHTIARLAQHIATAARVVPAVFALCTLLAVPARQGGTTLRAIALATVTGAADDHLAVAAGTIEQSGISKHRQNKPMRGWIRSD